MRNDQRRDVNRRDLPLSVFWYLYKLLVYCLYEERGKIGYIPTIVMDFDGLVHTYMGPVVTI